MNRFQVSGVRRKMIVRNYRDLKVWQKAMDLVVASYDLTRQFPQSELYGLVSQTQRAAVSIPANIAEGHGRAHLGDYLHHLSVANGSLMELETHCLLAGRLGYLKEPQVNGILDLTAEDGRMLAGLTKSLKNSRSDT
jgi:four helix bundle protein